MSSIQAIARAVCSRARLASARWMPEGGGLNGWLSEQKRCMSTVYAKKILATTQGKLKDVEVKVTNFEREDKGIAILAGDIFDVPIRPDIVHRVVRWQLAKRREVRTTARIAGLPFAHLKGKSLNKRHKSSQGHWKKPGPQKGSGRARHGSLRGPQFRKGATQHGPKPRSHEIGLQKQVRRLGLKVALSARVAEGKGLNVYSILQHDTLVMSIGAIRRIEERLHTPINR